LATEETARQRWSTERVATLTEAQTVLAEAAALIDAIAGS
jgi:hypothetical protein